MKKVVIPLDEVSFFANLSILSKKFHENVIPHIYLFKASYGNYFYTGREAKKLFNDNRYVSVQLVLIVRERDAGIATLLI